MSDDKPAGKARYEPRPFGHFPQPLAEPGVQQPQQLQDEDEADAVSRWLAHVEAGRIGCPADNSG